VSDLWTDSLTLPFRGTVWLQGKGAKGVDEYLFLFHLLALRMNRRGGFLGLGDSRHLVFAKHSDSLVELSNTGFKSIYLFVQFLRIAEDEAFWTFRRFEREVFPWNTHRVPFPALSFPSGQINSQPRRLQALHGLPSRFKAWVE
jgi:hypothetical protein